MVSLLAFLLVIAICVISHEWGHYATAKWRGVQVHEFSFGMGPSLYGKRKGETLWSLRAIPVGGFVRLEGMEDPEGEGDTPDPSRSFPAKKPWERFVILAGGAFCNIVLAWLLMAALLMFYGVIDMQTPRVGQLMPGYPAAEMGLEQNDLVVAVNGKAITQWSEIRSTLQSIEGDQVTLEIQRGGVLKTLTGRVPFSEKDKARLLGVGPSRMRYAPITALGYSFKYSGAMTLEILKGFGKLFTGRADSSEMAGPVGIAVMAGDAVKQGFWTFISIFAIINFNLGLLNLLPLPALDGGRIVFVVGEMLFRKKFPEEWESRVHYAGFMLLMAMIVLVTWKDIHKFFLSDG